MKITVDFDHCEVHGDCVVAAPEVFDIGDDDDVVQLLDQDPAEQLRDKVELAVRMCPVAAIKLAG